MVAAPLLAVATLMVGLRVGAKNAVRAAVLFGAAPGRPTPDGKVRLAWQLLTFIDDRGVRETVVMHGLSVVARTRDGREARWEGDSNEDGIAEIALVLDRLEPGAPLDVEVRLPGDPAPLASGEVVWGEARPAARGGPEAVRPSMRTGAIALDLLVEGERLVPGFETSTWLRLAPPAGASAPKVTLDPEPGLDVASEHPPLCRGDGALLWAHVPVVARGHVTGLGVNAQADVAGAPVTGAWFGPLPVAPGSFFVSLPRAIPAGVATEAVLVAPNPRHVAYAEVDDERGRVVAGALPVVVEPGDGTPRARFPIPPLAPGLHWLVVSGEPRGAERLSGAAIAKPFLVGTAPGVDADVPCSIGPWLAARSAAGFPRWLALDGLPARSSANRGRHLAGLAIALVALLAAVVLEVLLLTAASREARTVLRLAELEEGGEAHPLVTAETPGGSLAVTLLLTVLGFALLAVLVIAKG